AAACAWCRCRHNDMAFHRDAPTPVAEADLRCRDRTRCGVPELRESRLLTAKPPHWPCSGGSRASAGDEGGRLRALPRRRADVGPSPPEPVPRYTLVRGLPDVAPTQSVRSCDAIALWRSPAPRSSGTRSRGRASRTAPEGAGRITSVTPPAETTPLVDGGCGCGS